MSLLGAYLGKANDIGGQGCSHKALGLGGLMQESGLQGNETLWAQADLLLDGVLLPVPEGQGVPIRAGDSCWVETLLDQINCYFEV